MDAAADIPRISLLKESPPLHIEYAPVDFEQSSVSIIRKGFFDAFGRGEFQHVALVAIHFGATDEPILHRLNEVLPDVEVLRVVARSENQRNFDMLMRGAEWWGMVDAGPGFARFEIGAPSLERATEICGLLAEKFETRGVAEGLTELRVCTLGDTGSCDFRDVDWNEIEGNYPNETRRAMGQLIGMSSDDVRSAGGRVVILHGPPGTGKTWAMRALLTSWKSWAEGAVVLDPEVLFDDPMYMLRVSRSGVGKSSRVVVIEDADHIVERQGTRPMSISRLLNITDGVVGAANNSILLITTNSAPEELDRALLRPGRCLATVEFSPFDARAAQARLGAHHVVNGPLTLAEIYQRLGSTIKIESQSGSRSWGRYL